MYLFIIFSRPSIRRPPSVFLQNHAFLVATLQHEMTECP